MRTTTQSLSILRHHVNFPLKTKGGTIAASTMIQGYNLTVRLVATQHIDLNGLPIVDGIKTRGGDTILTTAQNDPKENGIWIMLPGDWILNEGVALLPSTIIAIREGWYNEDSIWLVANDTIVSYGYSSNSFVRKDYTPVKPCRFVLTDTNAALDETTTEIDGQTPSDGDRILVAKPGAVAENGIWLYSGAEEWTRSRDLLTSGMQVFVQEGGQHQDSLWALSTDGAILYTFAAVGNDITLTVNPTEWVKIAPLAACPPVVLHYEQTMQQSFSLTANEYKHCTLGIGTALVANSGVSSTSPFAWTVQETSGYDVEIIVETPLNASLDNRIVALTVRDSNVANTIVSDTTLVSAIAMRLADGWKYRLKGTILAEVGDILALRFRAKNISQSAQTLVVRKVSLKLRKLCY
jgi:hypothetical protein